MHTAGEGKYKVWLKQEELDGGLVYIVGGGERSHIGSVVVKEPGGDVEVIRMEGHRDDVVLRPIAEAACAKYGVTVAVVGGVHVDDASKEEIQLLVQNCEELIRWI